MNLLRHKQTTRGLTRVEVVAITFVLIMLAIVVLPALQAKSCKCQKINCTNNLKQVGLAFRIWAGDNNDEFPMAVPAEKGGAKEAALKGDAVRIFQVMSNELSTPKILVCPEDKHRFAATNFQSALTSNTVSYFVCVDATDANPQATMSGDDNLEVRGAQVNPGLVMISTNTPIAWSRARHKFSGNVMLEDGSVQAFNNSALNGSFFPTNSISFRLLAVP